MKVSLPTTSLVAALTEIDALTARLREAEARAQRVEADLFVLKKWPDALEYLAGHHDNQAAMADAIGEPELAECVKYHEKQAEELREQAAALRPACAHPDKQGRET